MFSRNTCLILAITFLAGSAFSFSGFDNIVDTVNTSQLNQSVTVNGKVMNTEMRSSRKAPKEARNNEGCKACGYRY